MNFTLLALTISKFSLTSPFISMPSTSSCQLNNHIFSKIQISNSLNSFLHMSTPYFSSHSQKTDISLTNSKFQHFLSSAISINNHGSKSYKMPELLDDSNEREYYKKRMIATLYSHEELVVRVRYCFFIDLTESNSGGAISMLGEESSLYVTRCCFLNCYAHYKGGAISFFGNFLRVNDTIFDYCATPEMAMAIEAYVEGTKEKMIFGGLSITNCPNETFLGPQERSTDDKYNQIQNVIEITKGKQILYAINSTNNAVTSTGGFCFSDESTSFSLSLSTIVSNVAECMFNLYDMNNATCKISYCNILNNTGYSMSLFDLDNSSILVSDCCIANNNFTYLATGGHLSFEKCVYDFDGKNVPVKEATFIDPDLGGIVSGIKKNINKAIGNWRSIKTVDIGEEYIELYEKSVKRCSRFTPQLEELVQLRMDRENPMRFHRDMFNDDFGGGGDYDGWEDDREQPRQAGNHWNDNDFNFDNYNKNRKKKLDNARDFHQNNRNNFDDDDDSFQKNENKHDDSFQKNENKDDDSLQKNDENKDDNNEVENPTKKLPWVKFLLIGMVAGIGAFVYLKYIKNKSRTNLGSVQLI